MRELASFASSEAGKTFARIEQHYGRDPAASLEGVYGDEVLAHNLRAALMFTMLPDEEPDAHTAAVEKTKQAGVQIRERMNA